MVSIEFASIGISILLSYIYLFDHKTRWMRMAGCFAIMICSIGLGVVGDTIPMFILMSVNLLISGLQFTKDVGSLIEVI